MTNIKPVSDSRNYSEVLKEADAESRVYLTKDGRDRYCVAKMLFAKLKMAEERAEREGWIDADDLEKEL